MSRRASPPPATRPLRGCGLSRQKIAYARAIAESGLDFARAARNARRANWWRN